MYGLRVGADVYESNKLTGAIDELYVYTSALDREAISVLYGSVTASPTVTPAPSTYYFEGTLRAYYSFDEGNATDATGAYSGDTYKNGMARNLGPTESRDGGDALGFDGEVYVVLPEALTYEALTGDEERTICLWARIDDWDGGFLRVRSDSADGASFGLAVGDAESNVTLALSGSYQTVVTIYGNTSYIDWDDWHHYCLTYDGTDLVLYFDGLAEATAPASLDTETMYGLRVGADVYESNKLTGAIDELYVYTSALDREAISVLYGSVTASPTVTPAPSTYYFEGTLRAYYSFDEGNATDATGAYSGDTYKNGMARNLGPTESRDGGDALGFDGETVVTIYGNTSYIDWDDWHHYCLTYDGTDLVLYFDGLAEATAPASLDTETMYGLRVGADVYESNKLTGAIDELYVYTSALDREAISVLWTVVTIYGNTSYIDWDDWHHYCLTYDGTDLVLYFDGLAEATAPASLDTETMYGLRVGADVYESNKLTGAIDELYVYTSALDREAISVLYGSVTASPTVTPAPSTYYFEGTLRAYYSFDEGNATDATGAYSGDTYKNGMARNLGPTESRDGGDALGFDGEVYVVLPEALTYEALTGDEERTICLWARIDDWNGGFLFEYGSDSADGASFGLAAGDAEGNVTISLSGAYETVVTVLGNTSYIDWGDWHHYCLTYDGTDVVGYFDGLAEADAPASLDTATTYGLRVGADMYGSNMLAGAIDELYVYTSALDREAISVLYGTLDGDPVVDAERRSDVESHVRADGDPVVDAERRTDVEPHVRADGDPVVDAERRTDVEPHVRADGDPVVDAEHRLSDELADERSDRTADDHAVSDGGALGRPHERPDDDESSHDPPDGVADDDRAVALAHDLDAVPPPSWTFGDTIHVFAGIVVADLDAADLDAPLAAGFARALAREIALVATSGQVSASRRRRTASGGARGRWAATRRRAPAQIDFALSLTTGGFDSGASLLASLVDDVLGDASSGRLDAALCGEGAAFARAVDVNRTAAVLGRATLSATVAPTAAPSEVYDRPGPRTVAPAARYEKGPAPEASLPAAFLAQVLEGAASPAGSAPDAAKRRALGRWYRVVSRTAPRDSDDDSTTAAAARRRRRWAARAAAVQLAVVALAIPLVAAARAWSPCPGEVAALYGPELVPRVATAWASSWATRPGPGARRAPGLRGARGRGRRRALAAAQGRGRGAARARRAAAARARGDAADDVAGAGAALGSRAGGEPARRHGPPRVLRLLRAGRQRRALPPGARRRGAAVEDAALACAGLATAWELAAAAVVVAGAAWVALRVARLHATPGALAAGVAGTAAVGILLRDAADDGGYSVDLVLTSPTPFAEYARAVRLDLAERIRGARTRPGTSATSRGSSVSSVSRPSPSAAARRRCSSAASRRSGGISTTRGGSPVAWRGGRATLEASAPPRRRGVAISYPDASFVPRAAGTYEVRATRGRARSAPVVVTVAAGTPHRVVLLAGGFGFDRAASFGDPPVVGVVDAFGSVCADLSATVVFRMLPRAYADAVASLGRWTARRAELAFDSVVEPADDAAAGDARAAAADAEQRRGRRPRPAPAGAEAALGGDAEAGAPADAHGAAELRAFLAAGRREAGALRR
ncbi:hypothetical protein JL720_15415 [Aureococcus anophagefferens]|nr:hypothetical protein JL720_15415 [Aureococcus anophagefferens]